MAAGFTDGATNLSVTLDGRPVKFQRIRSRVFPTALPADNLFNAPCIGAGLGAVPAGIYSPSIDDGFYATIHELEPGHHQLHFHAEGPGGFSTDVTYDLNIVRVLRH